MDKGFEKTIEEIINQNRKILDDIYDFNRGNLTASELRVRDSSYAKINNSTKKENKMSVKTEALSDLFNRNYLGSCLNYSIKTGEFSASNGLSIEEACTHHIMINKFDGITLEMLDQFLKVSIPYFKTYAYEDAHNKAYTELAPVFENIIAGAYMRDKSITMKDAEESINKVFPKDILKYAVYGENEDGSLYYKERKWGLEFHNTVVQINVELKSEKKALIILKDDKIMNLCPTKLCDLTKSFTSYYS